MTDQATEDHRDAASAVRELARDDVERKRFLKMAGRTMGAAGAATALGAFIAACGSSSTKSSSTSAAAGTTPSTTSTTAGAPGDLAIVNYALTLEYLEAEFYGKVVASGLFKGATLSTLKSFGSQEQLHVAALVKAAQSLGTPAPKPIGKFPLTGQSVTPDGGFDRQLTKAQVLAKAGPLIKA